MTSPTLAQIAFLQRMHTSLLCLFVAVVAVPFADRIFRAIKGSDRGFLTTKAWLACVALGGLVGLGVWQIRRHLERRCRASVLIQLDAAGRDLRLLVDGREGDGAAAFVQGLKQIRDDPFRRGNSYDFPVRADLVGSGGAVHLVLMRNRSHPAEFLVCIPGPFAASSDPCGQEIGVMAVPPAMTSP